VLAERRHNIFKLKIGKRAVRDDVAHVAAIKRAVGDRGSVRVDVNQNWDEAQADLGMRLLEEAGADLVEQPVARHALDAMARLSAKHVIPIMADEALHGPADEHPRATSLEALAKLKPVVRADGTVTAGNASGLKDGAAAMLVASEAAAARHGLTPRARFLGMAAAGIAPRIMGVGPIEAVRKLSRITGIALDQLDVIELNDAFASQAIATLRDLGVAPDDARVNRNGGAIALGHPLGMSGARITMSAVEELHRTGGRYAMAFMCIGVDQGIGLMLERVRICDAPAGQPGACDRHQRLPGRCDVAPTDCFLSNNTISLLDAAPTAEERDLNAQTAPPRSTWGALRHQPVRRSSRDRPASRLRLP
jgi:RNA-binding protein YhbY